MSLLQVMTTIAVAGEERAALAAAMRRQHPGEIGEAMGRGVEAGAADYLIWHGRREAYRQAYRDFFKEWDVLLAPVYPTPAFPHIPLDVGFGSRRLTVNGEEIPYNNALTYPAVATLSGQPATAFPVGLTAGGLLIGLQAIGPYLEDRTPIHFAALVAQEFGGFQRPPGYDDGA